MGIMVYSLLWAMQDLYHQQYHSMAQEVYFTERPPAVAVQALQCWLAIIIACGCQSEDMSEERERERERETPKPEALNPRK